jgi:hypothetical protein
MTLYITKQYKLYKWNLKVLNSVFRNQRCQHPLLCLASFRNIVMLC